MKDFIVDLWTCDLFGKILVVAMIALVLLLPFSVYSSIEAEKEWQRFVVSQNCKIVGREKGKMSTGIAPMAGGNGGVGVVIMQNPDKTGYLCDDGVTYWR